MTALARRLGFIDFKRGRRGWMLRLRWLEVSGGFGFACGLHNWSEHENWSLHLHLLWPNLFLKLPLPRRQPRDPMLDCWGFSLSRDDWASIHLNWGERARIVHLPWEWSHHHAEQLMTDGSWRNQRELERGINDPLGYRRAADHPDAWRAVLPYHYALRSGEIQERMATITVARAESRWRWLRRLPWPRRRWQGIDVTFSDEVGERSGSWKGGCIGCVYAMRAGETPEQCLRRMEAERKFN